MKQRTMIIISTSFRKIVGIEKVRLGDNGFIYML